MVPRGCTSGHHDELLTLSLFLYCHYQVKIKISSAAKPIAWKLLAVSHANTWGVISSQNISILVSLITTDSAGGLHS